MITRGASLIATIALAAMIAVGCGGDAAPEYNFIVTFNDRYTDAGGEEVAAFIRGFDEDAGILLQESFPPVMRGTLRTRRVDVCDEMLRRIGTRPDVASLNCFPAQDV